MTSSASTNTIYAYSHLHPSHPSHPYHLESILANERRYWREKGGGFKYNGAMNQTTERVWNVANLRTMIQQCYNVIVYCVLTTFLPHFHISAYPSSCAIAVGLKFHWCSAVGQWPTLQQVRTPQSSCVSQLLDPVTSPR